jgi:hypothetical protein
MSKRTPDHEKFTECARAGFTVLALNGKRPIDGRWTTRKLDNADTLKRIKTGRLNAGLRIPTGVIVLDADGPEGLASLTALQLETGFDPTPYHRTDTGGGGMHVIMAAPPGLKAVSNLSKHGYPKIDIRKHGNQIVIPGSVHPETGRTYSWQDDSPHWDTPLRMMPDSLLPILESNAAESHSTEAATDPERAERLLFALDATDFHDYDSWLRVTMAYKAAGGGRERWQDWCETDPQYADADAANKVHWDSIEAKRGDGITSNTLDFYVREAGKANALAKEDFADSPPDVSTEVVQVEARGLKLNRLKVAPDTYENACCAVMQAGLGLAFNELTQTVAIRAEKLPWDESYGRVLNEHTLRMLRLYLLNKHQGVAYQPGRDHLFEAVMTVAYAGKFNPVLDYVDSLTWDGVSRVDRLFSDYFGCADDDYTRAVSRCFVIGAVRRMRKPGCKFDTTPVLKGAQGIGKSTGIKTLFGAEYYSDTDLGNLRDKDAAMKLRGLWCHEFSEIDSLTRSETSVLKAFLSSATDRQRDPYGRIVENSPRRNVHFATVNEGGYLKDATGSRRFWPLHATKPIDLALLAKDRDQLWAEAAVLEARGESDVLPSHLWAVAGERQAAETSADPWIDTLRPFLDQRAWDHAMHDPKVDDDADGPPLPPNHVHTVELFAALGVAAEGQTKDKAQRLRTVMEAGLGWTHRKAVRIGEHLLAGYVRG